jgi:ATP-dependent exoDNAse (exonuclease V) beta subunit
MKSRIVKDLRDRGAFGEAQLAETGPIQTIHSFCERLLRENAIAAGIDPEFEILSEAQSSRVLSEAIQDAIASPLDELPEAEALVAALAGHRLQGRSNSPYAVLESAIETVLHDLRGSGSSREEIAATHGSPSALQQRRFQHVQDSLPRELMPAFETAEGDFQMRLVSAHKSLGIKLPTWIRGKWNDAVELRDLDHTCGLVQLASEAWWRLELQMEESQKLDFVALEARAVDLLSSNPSVRRRLADRFGVVMVDEAQDLNPVQHRLLNSLGCEREMIVGDAQQSIYGFRQADVEQFERRAGSGSQRLSRNFRSQPGVLRFVDFIFAGIWSKYTPMVERPPFQLDLLQEDDFAGVEFWEYSARDQSTTAEYIAQLLGEGVQPSEITVLTRDSFGAAETLLGLERRGIEARIAGGSERFYTRMEVRDLANTLRAASDPYDDFALLACLRSPMAELSLDSIVMLGRSRPVVEALENFQPPLDEDLPKLKRFMDWFRPLACYADRLSAWEVLGSIFARSDYLQTLASRRNHAQLLANVRKLLALAAEEPELGPFEFAERIRAIQDIRHKEGDAPAFEDSRSLVTIMTIHKAKGLEFDVVVLPQTNKSLTSRTPEVIADGRIGLVATKFERGESLFYRYMAARKKDRAREEELRVLYVAMTRAKKRLCVALYPTTSSDTVSKQLRRLIGDSTPMGVRVRSVDGGTKSPAK